MVPKFEVEAVSLPPDNSYPFHITAKRYTSPVFDTRGDDQEAFTLILLHSTSFFKEIWEPTLEDLATRISHQYRTLIREAWAIECPNHGASAILNEDVLQLPEHRHSGTCEKYALAAHRFLLAGSSKGGRVDFLGRNLVGIGHSLGGVAMSSLQHLQPRIQFKSIILIEPMLSPGGRERLERLRYKLVRSAYERRDVWRDRDQALEDLKRRAKTWDPRTFQLFVKFGLREHPGSRFTDTPYNGVTLACTRDEEAGMYRDFEGPTKPVLHLNEACSRLPVHIIFGTENDYIPRDVQDALVNSPSLCRFASISRVENTGHLVPQCAPKRLAELICELLVEEKGTVGRGDKSSRVGPKL